MTAGLTAPEPAASQREMDMLRQRVDQIDSGGTRGVGIIQNQITDLIKEVAELKQETRAWQTTHETQHEKDERDRTTGRRWLVGTGIAGIGCMIAILGLLVQLAQEIHH
jgi:hypothetical protein